MTFLFKAKCPFCKSESNQFGFREAVFYYAFDCKLCRSYFITENAYEKIKLIADSKVLERCIAENQANNGEYGKEICSIWRIKSERKWPVLKSNIRVNIFEDYY